MHYYSSDFGPCSRACSLVLFVNTSDIYSSRLEQNWPCNSKIFSRSVRDVSRIFWELLWLRTRNTVPLGQLMKLCGCLGLHVVCWWSTCYWCPGDSALTLTILPSSLSSSSSLSKSWQKNNVLSFCTLAILVMIQSNPLLLTKKLVGWLEQVPIPPNKPKVSLYFSKILGPLVLVVRLALVRHLWTLPTTESV